MREIQHQGIDYYALDHHDSQIKAEIIFVLHLRLYTFHRCQYVFTACNRSLMPVSDKLVESILITMTFTSWYFFVIALTNFNIHIPTNLVMMSYRVTVLIDR